MEKRIGAVLKKNEFLNLAQQLLNESDSSDDDIICLDNASKKETLKRPCKSYIAVSKDEEKVPKRRRRDKEEIENEKNQKLLMKIEREAQTAKNTKCEQYLYCHCSRLVYGFDPSIEPTLTSMFADRKIPDQLVNIDNNHAIVTWKRKEVVAETDNNQVIRVEKMVVQHVLLLVIDEDTFDVIVSTGLVDFVKEIVNNYRTQASQDPRLTIAILGKPKTNSAQIHFLSLDLFEKTQTQIRFIKSPADLCLLIAQMHRATAKYVMKSERANEIHLDSEKGVVDCPNQVEDWWNRMLGHVYRITEDCRRAVIHKYSNPFILMDKLSNMPTGEGMQHLAEIQTENGRFVGPALAQKIYFMLTSKDGREILDKA
ncbi:unnamed protein product [Bursaphelenchus okinawaensis]|uniref:ERCC4 domain-containing protein n=1 Tax=Bursaphelenchus okinawaensis TaxID=465554 RepID=A0A811JTG1_9BILA|nr:unnamed protein product [Bursaphelenchus okinawaensis]CAG9082145.1 unnamed protein product [Bursaphelenchus okinawaensis]